MEITAQTPYLIALLVMASIFTLIIGLRARRPQKRLTPTALAGNKSAPAPDIRQMRLSQPFQDRVFKPLLRRLYGVGRALTPARNIEMLQQNLIIAGLPGGLTVTDFLGLRFLFGAVLGGMAFAFFVSAQPAMTALLYAGIVFVLGLYAPNFWLNSKARGRQNALARALPDALDMMSICVDAGLGFEAAIQKVAYQWDNELALEMRRVISEIRLGVARAEALRNLSERTQVPDIANFVAVLVQADRLGVAIRDVLNTQSVQMRIRRRQRAQEQAAKAPVKMMIPMVLFIFPALFAIILGPVVPRLMNAFTG